MLSMIRSELFRIFKSWYLVFFLALIALVAAATPFALWLYQVWPAFAATGFVELPAEPVPSLQFYGVSFASGGFVAVGAGVMMGLFVSEDFKSGFVKNLVQARGGRLSYVVAVTVCAVLLSALAAVVGMAVVEVALRAQGYVTAATPPADVFQWFAQVALVSAAYGMVAALVALAFGSEALSTAAALFLGTGAAEGIARMVLANIPGMPAAIRDCLDGYLAVDMSTLGAGAVCDPVTYVQAAATILVVGLACALIMRRKSLG